MQFSVIAVAFFAGLAMASPIPVTSAEKAAALAAAGSCSGASATTAVAPAAATTKAASKAAATKAASSTAATGGSVLTSQAYNDISISGGVSGNAEDEANALFANVPTDLATVSAADLKIIGNTHDVAEDAEVGAFNPAIDAAGGTKAAPDIQNGKIKNKVLKLTATVLKLNIEAAQGADTAADLATESAKLANNIALDKAAAGQASTAVPFTGST